MTLCALLFVTCLLSVCQSLVVKYPSETTYTHIRLKIGSVLMCRNASFCFFCVGYSGELLYYNSSLYNQSSINKRAVFFSYTDLLHSNMSLEQLIYSVALIRVSDQ